MLSDGQNTGRTYSSVLAVDIPRDFHGVALSDGDSGSGVSEVTPDLRNTGWGVCWAVINIRNDRVDVRDTVADFWNDDPDSCNVAMKTRNSGFGIGNILGNVRDVRVCIYFKFSLERKVSDRQREIKSSTSKIRRIPSRSDLHAVIAFSSFFAWRRLENTFRSARLTTFLWTSVAVLRPRV